MTKTMNKHWFKVRVNGKVIVKQLLCDEPKRDFVRVYKFQNIDGG